MTQEEKDLLLKDLCARLPYGVKVSILEYLNAEILVGLDINKQTFNLEYSIGQPIFSRHNDLIIKPYLRPMSSMTEDEKEGLLNLLFDKEAKNFYIDEEGFIDGKTSDLMKDGFNYPSFGPINIVLYTNWLNVHHFDYRGLIEKGLALEAPEGMYKNK